MIPNQSPSFNNPKTTSDPSQDALKATVYDAEEMLDYAPKAFVSRKLLNKPTGSVTIVACDAGVTMDEKISAFDSLVLVLDGRVEVRIDSRTHHLAAGQCMIMPAHFRSVFRSEDKFKLLLTVIKSGYENTL